MSSIKAVSHIEQALGCVVKTAGEGPTGGGGCPPKLAEALHYAVFPGGARIRPQLCMAVAAACGAAKSPLAMAAACSIELLHCASLVHDDLPCFDDAALRRGKPSLHRAFDERLAVLSGDALIVLAFEILAKQIGVEPERAARVLCTVATAVGGPTGIVAGQAWECEERVSLAEYHRAKTGSLFAAATEAGALAAGADTDGAQFGAWRLVGDRIGEAYQVADDLHDVASNEADIGKPIGQDAALGRPSAVVQMGVGGAVKRLEFLVEGAVDAIPDCPGGPALRDLILAQACNFVPKSIAKALAA